MIVTDLKHVEDQVVLTPNMKTAIAFLVESGQDALPTGRHVIAGDRVYAEVQAYDTIEGDIEELEGHRRYLDIQYVAEGEEIIGWASIDQVEETTPYDRADDYVLANVESSRVTRVQLTTGQLAIMFPTDLHAPRRAVGSSSPVRKLVVKVALND